MYLYTFFCEGIKNHKYHKIEIDLEFDFELSFKELNKLKRTAEKHYHAYVYKVNVKKV